MKISQIVLVPGLLSTEAIYRPQIAALSGATIVAETRLDDTIEAMAERLLETAPDRFVLCGHSMGGYVALEVIRQAPERVTAMVLVATSARADAPEQSEPRRRLVDLARERGIEAAARLLNAKLFGSVGDRAALERLAVDMAVEIGTETFARQQSAIIGRRDQRATLAGIGVPTTVIAGTGDRIIAPERSGEMAAASPRALLQRLEGVGHMVPAEAPAALTEALRAAGAVIRDG